MSESINPMNIVKVIDNRLTAGRINEYAIEQGASSITYRAYPSSNLSTSNLTFNNINPPSSETFVDRTVYCQVKYQVNFIGTCPVGTNLLDGWGYDVAPRALPVNNSFKSLVVSINGSNFTQDQNDILPALNRIHFEKLKSYLSQSPTVLDNCQKYSEGVGSNANVLASTQNGTTAGVPARGGFEGVEILTNTPTSASIILTATEPLIISPLNYDDVTGHARAFFNVSTFQVNANFDPQLAERILSVSNTATSAFTNITASPLASNIYFGYYSSKLLQNLPQVVSYPWYPTTRFIQSGLVLAPNATTTLNMNNVQLSSIPKKLYLMIKPTRSSYNISQTDTFARIDNVSIQFGNRASLLANCDSNQLYGISKRNGVDLDYSNWYGSTSYSKPRNWSGVGSILAISPMKDLGLSELYTSGTSSTIQVQIQVTYTNIQPLGSAPLAYDAYFIAIDDGLITIPGPNVCLQQSSVVAPKDLVHAHLLEPKYTSQDVLSYEGGSFFSDIKDFFSKPVWKDIWNVTKTVAPYIAPLIGLGETGGRLKQQRVGAGLVGGKKISKKKNQN